jgi:hypothetical protein
MTAILRLPKKQDNEADEADEDEEEELTWAPGQEEFTYRLDSSSRLQSIFKQSGEHDSRLEETFSEEFRDLEQKFGSERGHWQLVREPELLILQDSVMIPDFAAQHIQDPQRRILIELVGFWKPDYLRRKLRKLKEAGRQDLLVLVYEGLDVSEEDFADIRSKVLFFKSKPIIKEILPVIEDMAERLYGPLPATGRRRSAGSPIPLEQMVRSYCQQAAQREEQEWLLLGQLEEVLKQLDPAFSPRHYGFNTLSALVQGHAALFATRRRLAKGRPMEVRLLQTEGVTQTI